MKIFIYLVICLLTNSCFENRKELSVEKRKVTQKIESDSIHNVNNLRKEMFENIPLIIPPLNSQKIDTLYFYDEGEYLLKQSTLRKEIDSKFFNHDKKINNSNDFYGYKRSFYPIYKTIKNNITIVGCLTLFYETDIPGILFELHSFDDKGKQLDYIIVYCRFTFEISYEYDFIMDENFNIKVQKKVIDYFDGDLDKEKEQPLIKHWKEQYILNDKGSFEKLD